MLGIFKKVDSKDNTNLLFDLLDPRFDKLDEENCFEKLKRIDYDLEPGAIYVETLKKRQGIFPAETNTLVIRVKSKNTAHEATEVLDKLFYGSGIRFQYEETEHHGRHAYLIRTNMDKTYSEFLRVFCAYRSQRERTPEQHAQDISDARSIVYDYARHSGFPKWQEVEHQPAFTTLIDLPGILRKPEEHTPHDTNGKAALANIKRREEALNTISVNGVPDMFDGISVYVNADKKGGITYAPPEYGFSLNHMATKSALAGSSGTELVFDCIGGYPHKPNIPWWRRFAEAHGLGWSVYGMATASSLVSGVATPAVTFMTASGVLGLTILSHRAKIVDRLRQIAKNRQGPNQEQIITAVAIETPALSHNQLQQLQLAYTREDGASLVETQTDGRMDQPDEEIIRASIAANDVEPPQVEAQAR